MTVQKSTIKSIVDFGKDHYFTRDLFHQPFAVAFLEAFSLVRSGFSKNPLMGDELSGRLRSASPSQQLLPGP